MKSTMKVVIVHGAYGSTSENWFPWLKERVEELGHEAVVPSFPTPEGQSLGAWSKAFADQVGPLTSKTILVGHSLAPAFILSLLETATVAVRGTFLVSGFLGKLGLPDFDSINESFVCRQFSWDIIRKNAGEVHVYNSDNDPYVNVDWGYKLADHLGVTLTVIKGGGHINAKAGFTAFPQLLKDLAPLLAKDAK